MATCCRRGMVVRLVAVVIAIVVVEQVIGGVDQLPENVQERPRLVPSQQLLDKFVEPLVVVARVFEVIRVALRGGR